VEKNRHQRVSHILDRGIRKEHRKARKLRRSEGAIIRALTRLKYMQDSEERPFENSEDEDVVAQDHQRAAGPGGGADAAAIPSAGPFRERGFGGLTPLASEKDDFGEEPSAYAGALRRMARRLKRWENHVGPELGLIRPIKVKREKPANGHSNGEEDEDEDRMDMDATIDPAETEDEQEVLQRLAVTHSARHGKTNGSARRGTNGHASHLDDDLTDVEKELLGEADGYGGDEGEPADGDDQDEDELTKADMTLLGLDKGESDTD
jgi:Ino eighty subunit 1